MCWPVLVLDWETISALPPPRRISVDVDIPVSLLPLIHPLVSLGSGKHHDRGQSLEFQDPQASEDR